MQAWIENSNWRRVLGAGALSVGVVFAPALLVGCSGDDGATTAGGTSVTDGGVTDGATDPGATSGSPTGATDPTSAGPSGSDTQGTTEGSAGTTTDSTTTDSSTSDATMTDTDTATDTGDGILQISPEDVVLEVIDGVIPMQMFTATYDGQDVTDDVEWLYEKPTIGSMMMGATFVPTGTLAGIGTLHATYQGAQDETGSQSAHAEIGARPRPLKPRLTEAEKEAHRAFMARLGDEPLWVKLGLVDPPA